MESKYKKGEVVYGVVRRDLEIAVKGKIVLLWYDSILRTYIYQLKINAEGTKNFYEKDIMLNDFKPNEWEQSKIIQQEDTKKAYTPPYIS